MLHQSNPLVGDWESLLVSGFKVNRLQWVSGMNSFRPYLKLSTGDISQILTESRRCVDTDGCTIASILRITDSQGLWGTQATMSRRTGDGRPRLHGAMNS